MIVESLSEMKIGMLNNHDLIGERIEVTPMIGIDSHSVYHFGYPLF